MASLILWIANNEGSLSALGSLISAGAALTALFFVVPQLRAIRESRVLESTVAFLNLMAATREDREYVYRHMPKAEADLSSLDDESRKHVERVITNLNDVAVLLENRAIPGATFLGMYHTLVIRCWYKLAPYAAIHEARLGGRYAHRVERLAIRAMRYHDAHRAHRGTSIAISDGSNPPQEVYRTITRGGIAGLFDLLLWFFRRRLALY